MVVMGKMPPRGMTRIRWKRRDSDGQGYGNASLTVPAGVARLVGDDRLFSVELTDDGILYRFVEGGEPVELPAWLR